ncbi:MAG: thiamine pyrophosphate-dependent dehydrogenase E1 component subunit alpha [Armatimonadota bacterium]
MELTQQQMIEMMRTMYTIRAFEQQAIKLYNENWDMGNFLGALHSYEGQEAVATGTCMALREDDYVFSTHRGHGHFIAKGGDIRAMFAELLGKETGCSHGRGGSMHMFDPSKGLMGGNGIVGAGTPLALGPAFAAQYRATDQVTVSFFGDGASGQGCFHEALNLASLWNLPVIYVCENNQIAVNTPADEAICTDCIADRAVGFNMPGVTVDGNDPVEVYDAAAHAVERARRGEGPSLIEAVCFRQKPHCMVIQEHRDEATLEEIAEEDPVPRFEERLVDERIMTGETLQDMRREVIDIIQDAAQYAIDAPEPDPAAVEDGVWA